jgi:hypothetical protein
MKKQWFTPDEVAVKRMACPLSIGQAEPGRYTFCIGAQCMAWTWDADVIEHDEIAEGDEIPEGWELNSEPFDVDGNLMVKIIRKPTHGRCGMVP